jgi:hypothetical protein
MPVCVRRLGRLPRGNEGECLTFDRHCNEAARRHMSGPTAQLRSIWQREGRELVWSFAAGGAERLARVAVPGLTSSVFLDKIPQYAPPDLAAQRDSNAAVMARLELRDAAAAN